MFSISLALFNILGNGLVALFKDFFRYMHDYGKYIKREDILTLLPVLRNTCDAYKLTRLEILSRPKAPKLHQELLKDYNEVLRNSSSRPTKLL